MPWLILVLSPVYAHGQAPEPASRGLRLETELREQNLSADVPRPTFIRADRTSGRTDREMSWEGRAQVRKGNMVLSADRITYYEADDEMVAVGNVRVAREGQVMVGPQLQISLESMRGEFNATGFSLAQTGGRGRADRIEFLGRGELELTNGVYTSCRAEDPDWYLKADRITLDEANDEGTASWGTLYFKDLPIFKLPSVSFGLSEDRRTGFMAPIIGQSSTVGFEVRVPFYWSIAPNRDVLVWNNFTEKRGFQLGGVARYIEPGINGTTLFEYTPQDRLADRSRWMINSQHTDANFFGWAMGWNLRAVSDENYFVDYARSIVQSAERSLPRNVFASRGWDNWMVRVNVMQFQNILDARASPPYDRLPQLVVSHQQRDVAGLDFGVTVDTNNFRRDMPGTAQGWRITANPSVSMPLSGPAWYITPKATVHATAYRLEANPGGPNDIDRVVPIASIDSGMTFERTASLGSRPMIQTLEPRLFYVHAPYRNQTQIPVFDSGLPSFSFASLFSENTFVGSDRIADANHLTAGAVSRFIDPATGAEALRLAIAQRQYFSTQQVTLPGTTVRSDTRSDLLLAASGSLGGGHFLDAGAQLSVAGQQVPRFGASWRWWPSWDRLFNLAVRFQDKDFAQIDTSWRLPLGGRWSTVGRINYSVLREQLDPTTGAINSVTPQLLEGLLGLEYRDDCWAVRLVAQRFLTATATQTTSISMQFELSGFARVGLDGFENILLRNIPGYRTAELRPIPMSKFHGYE